MNEKTTLIQAIAAIPNNEESVLSQSLSCEIKSANLICMLGQNVNIMNIYLEMLAGVKQPYKGVINYSEDLLNKDSHHNCSAIKYIYHNSTLLSILNGIDNIKVPALYHHLGSAEEINRNADALLAELKYDFNHKQLPAFMDTFQKRYLLIIRAIMLKPKILFIESPFMNLDREQACFFGEYLARLGKDKNITVIASNVTLNFAQSYADQIIYLTATDIHVFREKEAFSSYMQVTLT